jgi:ricin-type beta-trefoil lectin protein
VSARTDDRGSLPLAMLLIVVGVGLSGLLASSVNEQLLAARYTAQRADALDAAQSGIQIGLAHIRTAEAADGSGDATKLPCGPWSGTMSGGTRQTYSVTIYYLAAQPPAGDTTWAQANKLPCTATTYGSATPQPLYAMLASTGTVVTGERGRTVTATYALQSRSRDTVAGGLIRAYGLTSPDFCFAASSAAPVAGTALLLQVCDGGSDAQRFAYTRNLGLVLVATRQNGSAGMCLDAVPSNNTVVRFQACTGAEQQQWSFNGSRNFAAINAKKSTNICFHVTTPGTAGSGVTLHAAASDPAGVSAQDAACGMPYSTSRTFSPDLAVGAGNAAASSELANFGQFSTCVADDNDTSTLMQPCEQLPASATFSWQLSWNLPAPGTTGRIWVTSKYGNKDYCLTSPGAPASGTYVTLTQCPATLPASMLWSPRGNTGVYATTYRIESSYGAPAGTVYCLSPADPAASPPDPNLALGVARLVMASCTSSTLQKWDAPASILTSSLVDVGEK